MINEVKLEKMCEIDNNLSRYNTILDLLSQCEVMYNDISIKVVELNGPTSDYMTFEHNLINLRNGIYYDMKQLEAYRENYRIDG